MIRLKEEAGTSRQPKEPIVTRMFGAAKKKKRPVTKSANIVTPRNTPEKGGDCRTGKGKAPNPPPAPEVRGVGRPKTHATAADRQRAYRERQKGKA